MINYRKQRFKGFWRKCAVSGRLIYVLCVENDWNERLSMRTEDERWYFTYWCFISGIISNCLIAFRFNSQKGFVSIVGGICTTSVGFGNIHLLLRYFRYSISFLVKYRVSRSKEPSSQFNYFLTGSIFYIYWPLSLITVWSSTFSAINREENAYFDTIHS